MYYRGKLRLGVKCISLKMRDLREISALSLKPLEHERNTQIRISAGYSMLAPLPAIEGFTFTIKSILMSQKLLTRPARGYGGRE